MIRNYIVVTFRNFVRNRNYALINVLGLSIGLTSCIVLFLLIRYELKFDTFHSRYDNIFRITQSSISSSGEEHSSATPYPLIGGFRNDFPEIPLTTQLHFQNEVMLSINNEKFMVRNALFADSLFFDVFDFHVLSGNPGNALAQPGKILITRSLADKIGYESFGSSPPRIMIQNLFEVEIAGVVSDPPVTSHIQFELILPMRSLTADFIGGMDLNHWGLTASGYTYVVLPDHVTRESVEERFKGFIEKYYNKRDGERRSLQLQPLRDIHFDEKYTENPSEAPNASIGELWVMAILGVFILVIACINFINLSTALAIRKSKEIGIRKTLGAKRGQLTFYFLLETFLITLASVVISLGATEWLTSWLNSFTGKEISLDLFSNPSLVIFLIVLVAFTSILSGSYPALILSGFNPVAVLKNKMSSQNSSGGRVRKFLVVCQFIIAQVLIIGTLIISDQMEYFRTKPLGFDKDAVLIVPVPDNKKEKLESLRVRLESNPDIRSVSYSLGAPTSENNFGTSFYLTENPAKDLFATGVKPVDYHYRETYGLTMRAGRWFTENEEKAADPSVEQAQQHHVYIVNESAARRLGFNNPEEIIGKNITTGVNRIDAEVVGVVNDFHVASLHSKINPVVMLHLPSFYFEAGIKVNSSNLSRTLDFIEKHWNEVYPDYYYEYEFLDEKLAALYRRDQRSSTLLKIFAGISIFIGCLGLYGLVSFMANQKMKEVGIRKVMGASVQSILILFSGDFVRLILVAFVFAAPLSWYLMNQWLDTYAYHIAIHWSVFVVSVVATLIIALATVSYRAVRAAITNPAETLRTE
jgi:putative ABC transport system permease protein